MPPDTRSGEADVPPAVLEDVLSAPRRRRVLRTLRERDGPVPLSDVAAAVCEREGLSGAGAATEECRAVRDDIYGRHLPKLTAAGLVEYDSMRGTLELGPVDAGERLN